MYYPRDESEYLTHMIQDMVRNTTNKSVVVVLAGMSNGVRGRSDEILDEYRKLKDSLRKVVVAGLLLTVLPTYFSEQNIPGPKQCNNILDLVLITDRDLLSLCEFGGKLGTCRQKRQFYGKYQS